MNYIKRPEMFRPVSRERVIERVIEKPEPQSQPIDINALASAIAQIIKTMPVANNGQISNSTDTFDNSKTLEKLATTMTVQRGNNESNFDNLGNEHHTKTDKEEVAKTIDLLSNLGD